MLRTTTPIGSVIAIALLAGCGSSSSDPCDPECRVGFECYFGICVPAGPDAGSDTAVDGDTTLPDDAADRPETAEVPPDVPPFDSGCSDPGACDDGDPCTVDSCDSTGACLHAPAVDGTLCTDDGDPCSQDVCVAGVCVHPVAEECCLGPEDCDDGNPCTTDDCGPDHLCRNEALPDCCARDADCLWEDHLWECDAAAGACYDPPGGEFCAGCYTRRDCGDGGESSDDWCVTYAWNDRGCTKDCLDDADCPGAAYCRSFGGDAPCAAGETGCICVSRLGSCEAYNVFGRTCLGDATCRTCDACGALVCNAGRCTWRCEVLQDCPLGAVCEGGLCVPAG